LCIFEQARQPVPDGLQIERINQQCGVAGNLGECAAVRAEHHTAAGHSFQHRHAKAFIQRGQRQ
jgi:hypothetical protein